MELVQVGEKTYYIKNPTNIGVYKINESDVYLIDTGNDSDAGKKILKIMNEKGWNVVGIINTHSHADHIGGNKVIQDRTNATIYAYGIEAALTKYPLLEPAALYGSNPLPELQNKFLYAKPSEALELEKLPDGLEYFLLRGHTYDMVGIKTSDDVYFLGDSVINEATIDKYRLSFLYDVKEFLASLEQLKTIKGKLFIPSHGDAQEDIQKLIEKNEENTKDIIETVYQNCNHIRFEDLLKKIFEHYHLVMNITQYYLIGCTLKAYLTYLYEESRIKYEFSDNQMFWIRNEEKE